MRLILAVLVLLAACKKDDPAPAATSRPADAESTPTPPPPAPTDAAPDPARDAAPALDAAPAAAPDADAWRSYPVGDAFVQAPVKPVQSQTEVPIEGGEPTTAAQYVFTMPDGAGMFMVAIAAMPKDLGRSVDEALAEARDFIIANYGSTVVSDEPVKVDGARARDISFFGDLPDAGPFYGRALVVIHGHNAYSAVYMRLGTGDPDRVGARLIGSFGFKAP